MFLRPRGCGSALACFWLARTLVEIVIYCHYYWQKHETIRKYLKHFFSVILYSIVETPFNFPISYVFKKGSCSGITHLIHCKSMDFVFLSSLNFLKKPTSNRHFRLFVCRKCLSQNFKDYGYTSFCCLEISNYSADILQYLILRKMLLGYSRLIV